MCICWGRGAGQRPKEEADPLKLEFQAVVSHLMWVLQTELGPQEEQQGPLTVEPSLPLFIKTIVQTSTLPSQECQDTVHWRLKHQSPHKHRVFYIHIPVKD